MVFYTFSSHIFKWGALSDDSETNIASRDFLLRFKEADEPCMGAISLERHLADIPDLQKVVGKPVVQAFQHPNARFRRSRLSCQDM